MKVNLLSGDGRGGGGERAVSRCASNLVIFIACCVALAGCGGDVSMETTMTILHCGVGNRGMGGLLRHDLSLEMICPQERVTNRAGIVLFL